MKEHGISIAPVCSVVRLLRTAWHLRPGSRMERDRDVIEVLNESVVRKPRWGLWELDDRLRLKGCRINHKRLDRVYSEMGLNLPRRMRRRLPADALYRGRWFRTLNVIDEGNRHALGSRCDSPAGKRPTA